MCVCVLFINLIQPPLEVTLMIFFFSLSVAHDTIAVGEVKLEFMMASIVLFVLQLFHSCFSFPKVTLSVMQ